MKRSSATVRMTIAGASSAAAGDDVLADKTSHLPHPATRRCLFGTCRRTGRDSKTCSPPVHTHSISACRYQRAASRAGNRHGQTVIGYASAQHVRLFARREDCIKEEHHAFHTLLNSMSSISTSSYTESPMFTLIHQSAAGVPCLSLCPAPLAPQSHELYFITEVRDTSRGSARTAPVCASRSS